MHGLGDISQIFGTLAVVKLNKERSFLAYLAGPASINFL